MQSASSTSQSSSAQTHGKRRIDDTSLLRYHFELEPNIEFEEFSRITGEIYMIDDDYENKIILGTIVATLLDDPIVCNMECETNVLAELVIAGYQLAGRNVGLLEVMNDNSCFCDILKDSNKLSSEECFFSNLIRGEY